MKGILNTRYPAMVRTMQVVGLTMLLSACALLDYTPPPGTPPLPNESLSAYVRRVWQQPNFKLGQNTLALTYTVPVRSYFHPVRIRQADLALLSQKARDLQALCVAQGGSWRQLERLDWTWHRSQDAVTQAYIMRGALERLERQQALGRFACLNVPENEQQQNYDWFAWIRYTGVRNILNSTHTGNRLYYQVSLSVDLSQKRDFRPPVDVVSAIDQPLVLPAKLVGIHRVNFPASGLAAWPGLHQPRSYYDHFFRCRPRHRFNCDSNGENCECNPHGGQKPPVWPLEYAGLELLLEVDPDQHLELVFQRNEPRFDSLDRNMNVFLVSEGQKIWNRRVEPN